MAVPLWTALQRAGQVRGQLMLIGTWAAGSGNAGSCWDCRSNSSPK